MKKILLVMMMFLLLTSVGLAEDNTEQEPTDLVPIVGVDGPIEVAAVEIATVVVVAPVESTEVPADAELTPAVDEPILKVIPAIIKELPNMPDIEKVTEIAEEEGAPWGTYGGVLVLILAAIVGFIKVQRKKEKNLK